MKQSETITGKTLLAAWASYSGDLTRLFSNNGISESDIDPNKDYECVWPEHCVARALTDSEMTIHLHYCQPIR